MSINEYGNLSFPQPFDREGSETDRCQNLAVPFCWQCFESVVAAVDLLCLSHYDSQGKADRGISDRGTFVCQSTPTLS